MDKDTLTVNITALFQRLFGNIAIRSFFGTLKDETVDGEDVFTYISTML